MKRIVIILIGLISVAYGQSQPTSAKTRFVNGLYVGTKLDSYFAAADSNAIYWRADSALMAKYKGTARRVVFSGELGPYKLVADTFFTNGYTTRGRTKQQIDSLSNAIGSGFVTIGTTQTITGAKTFTLDASFNDVKIGKGGGSISTNTLVGGLSMASNTTGEQNSVFGFEAMKFNTIGSQNSVLGYTALSNNISGGENTVVGHSAMFYNTSGAQNTAIGDGSLLENRTSNENVAIGYSSLYYNRAGTKNTAIGAYSGGNTLPNRNQSGSNNTYIGYLAAPSDTARTNETVIGASTTGNGSNTVTIGNSSVVGNYFNGFLKQTSVTSSVLKADGSGVVSAAVAGTDYVAPSALSGYLPLSGGTLTGNLNGTTASFAGSGSTTTLSVQAANNVGAFRWLNGAGTSIWTTYSSSGSDLIFRDVVNGVNAFTLNANSVAASFTVPINGTSLSMSGNTNLATNGGASRIALGTTTFITDEFLTIASNSDNHSQIINVKEQNAAASGTAFVVLRKSDDTYIGNIRRNGTDNAIYVGGNSYLALGADNSEKGRFASDGTFLINTTTTDGVNKLIVNGGVKGSGQILADNAGTNIRLTGDGGSGADYYLLADGSGGAAFRNVGNTRGFTITNTNVFAHTGAATFSSSVTASSLIKSGGTSSQALIADGSVQTLTSGTYTPTLTGISNVSAIAADASYELGYYTRVGNIVTVYGTVNVTPTASSTLTTFNISFPIVTSYTKNGQAFGSSLDNLLTGFANPSGDIAVFSFRSTNTSLQTFSYSFSYIVQ